MSNDSGISAPKDEIFAITIPLNNLGPAGLGISVKGKISGIDSCDLGIYIKSIIKGGAASKVGTTFRLITYIQFKYMIYFSI